MTCRALLHCTALHCIMLFVPHILNWKEWLIYCILMPHEVIQTWLWHHHPAASSAETWASLSLSEARGRVHLSWQFGNITMQSPVSSWSEWQWSISKSISHLLGFGIESSETVLMKVQNLHNLMRRQHHTHHHDFHHHVCHHAMPSPERWDAVSCVQNLLHQQQRTCCCCLCSYHSQPYADSPASAHRHTHTHDVMMSMMMILHMIMNMMMHSLWSIASPVALPMQRSARAPDPIHPESVWTAHTQGWHEMLIMMINIQSVSQWVHSTSSESSPSWSFILIIVVHIMFVTASQSWISIYIITITIILIMHTLTVSWHHNDNDIHIMMTKSTQAHTSHHIGIIYIHQSTHTHTYPCLSLDRLQLLIQTRSQSC